MLYNGKEDDRIVFIDANVFYMYCLQKNILTNKETSINAKIKDQYFYNFIDNNFKKGYIGIAEPFIFEIVSKNRKKLLTLKKMIYLIRENSVKFLGVKPFFELDETAKKNLMLKQKVKISRCTVNYIYKKKMKEEANLLSLISQTLVHEYLVIQYMASTNGTNLLSAYNSLIQNTDILSSIKKIVTTKIEKILKKGYRKGKDSEEYRKYFEETLELTAELNIHIFELLNNQQNLQPSTNFFSPLQNYRNLSSRGTSSRFANFYKNIVKGTNNQNQYFLALSNSLKLRGYTDSQTEHLKNMLNDLFVTKKKINKNDSIDLTLLGYIRDEYFLLTFDENMLKAIRIGDVDNYNFIKSFYK